ncbi:MAG: hypothetical protein ACOC2H_10025 [Spirochaetota bacterium]
MMTKFRGLFYKITVLLLTVLLCVSCSRQGKIRFCEKTDGDGKPGRCGTKFTVGELSMVLESQRAVGTDMVLYKFFTEESSDKMPVNVVRAEADPESKTVIKDVELYNAGSFRIVAEREDGTALGSGDLTVIDIE